MADKLISVLTNAVSTINFFKNVDVKGSLIKMGIGLVVTLLSSGGLYFIYKWAETRSDHQLAAAVSAAHSAGIAETNSSNALAANKALVENIKKLQDMQNQTQKKLDNIQKVADASKKKIDSFDVKSLINDNPDKIEKWANDTNSGLFNDISAETMK